MAATTSSRGAQQPWWEQLPPITATGLRAPESAANDLQARVTALLGPLTPDDRRVIEQRLGNLGAYLTKARAELDGMTASIAQHKFRLLRDELSKTDENQRPNAVTITQTGDWLLENVPALGDSLVRAFADPALGKVIGRAGPIAVAWTQQRLGGLDSDSGAAGKRNASSWQI